MSASISWERPPVEVEQHHVGANPLFNLLADECFDGDTSRTVDVTVVQGDTLHQRLSGALAAWSFVSETGTEAGDAAEELEQLLGGIARWGSAVVRVTR